MKRMLVVSIFTMMIVILAGCGGSGGSGGSESSTSDSSSPAITAITSFNVPGQTDVKIDNAADEIELTVPFGTDVTSLAPAIRATASSIVPAPGVPQDFRKPVIYTVTASDLTSRKYLVSVNVGPNPADAIGAITAFNIPAQSGVTTINEGAHTVALSMPFGTNVTALVPEITIIGASIDPASGVPANFTTPQTYTVTAEDASLHPYSVTVTVLPDPDIGLVAADKAALAVWSIIGDNPYPEHITLPLTNPLPALGSNGSAITWSSGSPSIISHDGQTISRPLFASGDAAVTMTATFTKGAVTDTKVFNLLVLKLPPSNNTIITSAVYTISTNGTSPETISNIPYGTPKSVFLANLTKGQANQYWADSGLDGTIVRGNTLVVIAQDRVTETIYRVSILPTSSKAITNFTIAGQVGPTILNEGAHTIAVTMPLGTNLSALTPTIFITGASVNPASGETANFMTSQMYMVTAADTTLQNYTVTVSVTPPDEVWVDPAYAEGSSGGHFWGQNAFSSIQPAIDIINAGGIINVATGTYTENVNISKALTITGTNAVIDGDVTFDAKPITLTGVTQTAGKVCYVTANGSIQTAINAAPINGTVNVGAGTYKESNLLVDKTLTIEGTGASSDDVVVAPAAEDANLDNAFTSAQNGFIIKAAHNVTLRKLTIDGRANTDLTAGKNNFRAGVVTLDASQAGGGAWNNLHIDNVSIKYTYRRGISVFPRSVYGTIIENSRVDSVAFNHGMYIGGQSQILGNTVNHVFQGIVCDPDATTTNTDLVKVNGNTLTNIGNYTTSWGYPNGQPRGIQCNPTGVARTFEVKNNSISDNGLELYAGAVGVYTRLWKSDSVLSGNTISLSSGVSWAEPGSQSVGMLLGWNYEEGFTVANNHVTSSKYGMGMMIFGSGGVAKPMVLEGNTITSSLSAALDTGDGSGIYIANQYLFAGDKNPSNVVIQNDNAISGFVKGINVEKIVTSTQSLTVTAHGNSITDNDTGIDASTLTAPMDATNNWWGDATGRFHSTNPGGLGNPVSDFVTFNPWSAVPLGAKAITGFTIAGQIGPTTIDEMTHAISLVMPFGTDVSALVPVITMTGVSVNPASGVPANFILGQTYTVTAANSSVQDYLVTVIMDTDPDIAAVAADKLALVNDVIKGANSDLEHITLPLPNPLPALGPNGSTITWSSGSPAIVSHDGQTINRPIYGSGNATVTMTATFQKGAVIDTKLFTLTVLELPVGHIATITSAVYTVSTGGTSQETISNIPYGTAKSVFLANLIKGHPAILGGFWRLDNVVVRGNTLVVIAQDKVTEVVYRLNMLPASSKMIINFTIAGQIGPTNIDEGAHTINVPMAYGANLSSLAPSLTITGRSVSPESGTTHNFIGPVTYTVTAADWTTQDYVVTVQNGLSSIKNILSFTIFGQVGLETIDQITHTIGVTMPFGTDVSALVPTIFGVGASINPAIGVPVNFTTPQIYTVTAENSSTVDYLVTVTLAPNPDIAAVAADKEELLIGYILDLNPDEEHITLHLRNPLFPTGPRGSSITWASSHPAIISHDGQTINRPEYRSGNATVTMTATFTRGAATATKDFVLIVLQLTPSSDATIVTGAFTVINNGSPGALITNVPWNMSKADFLALISKGESHQSWADSGLDDPIKTHNTLIVISQDGVEVDYRVRTVPNPIKQIISFLIPGQVGGTVLDEINHTIGITVPFTENLALLSPAEIIIKGAFVNPESGVYRNFTNPVIFTVTAADLTTQDYTVTVSYPPSPNKNITAFTIPGQSGATTIDQGNRTIAIDMPFETNVTALIPAITITGASVDPASGVPANFTTPQTYTVTAADASMQSYAVTVTVLPSPDMAAVLADKAALVIDSIKGANPDLDRIRFPLTNPLPSLGSNGSAITWSSDSPAIVSHDGQTINRSAYGSADATVTMTATLTKGAETDTKVFTLNVLALPASNNATVTSAVYTVSVGASPETISNIPYGTPKAVFLANLVKGQVNQLWADSGLDDIVVRGNTLVVVAENKVTEVVYRVSILPRPPDEVWVDDNYTSISSGDHVWGYDAFSSIQPAIDIINANGTVHVAAGLYKESNILVNKTLTIEGSAASRNDVVIAPAAEDANLDNAFTSAQNGFIIKAHDVTLRKLTINGRANTDLTPGKNNFRAGIVTMDASQPGGGAWNNLHIDNVVVKFAYRRGISVFPRSVSGTIVENSGVDSVAYNHCMYICGQSQVLNNTINHCFQGIVQDLDASAPAGLLKVNGNTISQIGNFPGCWGDQGGGVYWGQPRAIQFNNSDSAGRQVEIRDNVIDDIGSDGPGGTVGIYTRLANSDSIVDNNTITLTSGDSWAVDGGSQAVGMLLGWSYANGFTVTNNHLSSSGYGMGVMIFGTGTVDKPLVLEGNTITATGSTRTTQGDGTGIYIANQYLFGGDKNESYAYIQNDNAISGFVRGIDVEKVVTSTQPLTVVVSGNSIAGNTTGIDASTLTAPMDARHNWWGDASGPYNATTNPTGTGNAVSDNVNYQLWLTVAP